jgi:signal transduction histidine kinase/DNA-binding response OmpR family regulator
MAIAFAPNEKVNILVVDDLPQKHVVFRTVLEDLGENVVTVTSGREALREVMERAFAVILLDVNMPGMDGFETASLLRSYPRTANTPIIFITAYIDDVDAIRGYALGAVDYISSPVIPEILRSKVRVFVEMYRMNRQLLHRASEQEALARAEAQRIAADLARRRADFLANATLLMTRSLDVQATISQVLDVVVPSLADLAIVSLVDEEGKPCQTIWRSSSAVQQEPGLADLHAIREGELAVGRELEEWISRVLHTGEPHKLNASELELIELSALTRSTSSSRSVHSPFARSDARLLPLPVKELSIYPLLTGVFKRGALTLGHVNTPSDVGDASLALEVTSRASIALENAFLFSAIQDADRRKNEFLAMLAHELRNPLAPVRNAVQVLRTVGSEDSVVSWAREIIGVQVDHMVRIVDDLLDVSRIARGSITLSCESVSLATLLERAIDTSKPHLVDRGQTFTYEPCTEDSIIEGDIVRLAQIVSNLLNNASKFSPPGGHVLLSAEFDGHVTTITVSDDGQGIDPTFLPHVFDLFVQGDTSLDRSQGGLGIGLTLVRQLTEMHNGTVECFSAGVDRGARFVVRLPARKPVQRQLSPSNVVPILRNRTVRVLVVDDVAASMESLTILLELQGHQVRSALDGISALEVAQSFLPDAVILDIGLPGMNGYEVAKQLRSDKRFTNTLLIALTGYGQEEDHRRTAEAGIDEHFVKPADLDRLFRVITTYAGSTRFAGSGGPGTGEVGPLYGRMEE